MVASEGESLEHLVILSNQQAAKPNASPAPPVARFGGAPENSTLFALARRTSVVEIRWPTQTKYKNNPAMRG